VPDQIVGGGSVIHRCRDIEKRDLISPLSAIERRQLHRVSGILEIFKLHTLDDTTSIDIQTGNDPNGEGHQMRAA
jgi:hypothetical protein